MKWSMVILDLWIREMGLDAFKVIDMHDEAQWDSEPQYADLVGRLGCMSIVEAGKLLNMKLPLKGEYKIGPNWAHTH
jgi:DNA polymerase I-like protein with 3'-5' exonuclease and polymerase domains